MVHYRQLTYDVTHRPERIDAGGKRLVFRYDGEGNRYLQRRQESAEPGVDRDTSTVYPFTGYEVEVKRSGNSFVVLSGRQMLGDYAIYTASIASPQGQMIYRHGDRLGSPAAQTNAQAQSIERRGFDAFGAPREGGWQNRPNGELGSAVSPRGFTGHEHLDDVGGLVHVNGRAYDPLLGRFLSVDPIIQFPSNSQSLNPYSYILNNPMAGTDPSGYSACNAGDSVDRCAKGLGEGEQRTVRTTPTGSHISREVGTVTGLGGGAVLVSAAGGGQAIITGMGSGASAAGASGSANGLGRADGIANGTAAMGQFKSPVETQTLSGSFSAQSTASGIAATPENAWRRLQQANQYIRDNREKILGISDADPDRAYQHFQELFASKGEELQLEFGGNVVGKGGTFGLEGIRASHAFDPATGVGYSVPMVPPREGLWYAFAHTHPANTLNADPRFGAFSDDDIGLAHQRGINMYVALPGGSSYFYRHSTGSVICLWCVE
jgi:RHS repeat-associated protein